LDIHFNIILSSTSRSSKRSPLRPLNQNPIRACTSPVPYTSMYLSCPLHEHVPVLSPIRACTSPVPYNSMYLSCPLYEHVSLLSPTRACTSPVPYTSMYLSCPLYEHVPLLSPIRACTSPVPHTCHMSCPSYSSWFYHAFYKTSVFGKTGVKMQVSLVHFVISIKEVYTSQRRPCTTKTFTAGNIMNH
jgi:hypothetical protein